MRFLALIGALAIIAAIGAAIYFFGGFYNVAQNADNPAIVDWALASARGASVVAHGTETPPANLDDRRDDQGRRSHLFDDRLRQLSRRAAGRQLGQVVRRAEAGPRRSQGHGERAHRLTIVLGDQERHQVHRHAELRHGRRVRSGPVVDRRFHQEAADRDGRRIQGLDGVPLERLLGGGGRRGTARQFRLSCGNRSLQKIRIADAKPCLADPHIAGQIIAHASARAS